MPAAPGCCPATPWRAGGPSVTEEASGKFHRIFRRRSSRSAFWAGLPTCTKPVASSQMNIPPCSVLTNEPPRTLISVVAPSGTWMRRVPARSISV